MLPDEIKGVWVTWERQRRSLVLADHFRATFFMYDRQFSFRILRYLFAAYNTVRFLLHERPDVVFGQNPSLVLALVLCCLRPLFRFTLIIDRHSNFMLGVKGRSLAKSLFKVVSNATIRGADVTIVTNNSLKQLIDAAGGTGIVLQDKLPELAKTSDLKLTGHCNIVFVTSFSDDEPIDEVLAAFENLDVSARLYVTGNYRKHPKYVKFCQYAPDNIVFTGFLSDADYVSLLNAADIVMCLTKNDFTLTCGAYEGIALSKPLIVSNTATIREYFSQGAVYVDPDRLSIRDSILNAIRDKDRLRGEVQLLKARLETDWQERCDQLSRTIVVKMAAEQPG